MIEKKLRSLISVFLSAWLIAGCSSTLHFEADAFYTVDADGSEISQHEDEAACISNGPDSCKRARLKWETELYCGIYRSAPNNVTDKNLRVGRSPTTVEGWISWEDKGTVLAGDDESYEVVIGERVDIDSDSLCGKFDPSTDLVDVREGDVLMLQIYCRSLMNGIRLMPPVEQPYRFKVQLAGREDSWFGCN